ncbi:MAG TPA: hypothetical protein PLE61_09215 [Vicinamibacterales bacterium]|nr:hypothetical protein [Vicinamibacterales bacterium]
MTLEQPTPAAAIAKLEALASQRRAAGKKAGNPTKEVLDEWTELFAVATAEDPAVLGTALAIPGLPPRVAGAGIARLWPQLDPSARARVLRLLPKDADRGSPMRFTLASELMKIDPTTAAEVLADLPRSNENVGRLGRLLREQPKLVAALVLACPARTKGESLLLVLLRLARASETTLPARLEVIRVGLAWLAGEGAPDFGPGSVGDALAELVGMVDPRARASFDPDLAAVPALWVRVFPDRPIPARAFIQVPPDSPVPAAETTTPAPSGQLPLSDEAKQSADGTGAATPPRVPTATGQFRVQPGAVRSASAPEPPAVAVADVAGQLRQLDIWLNELEQHARILKAARGFLGQSQRDTAAIRSELADKIQELETTTTALRTEAGTLRSERDQARADVEAERQAHNATREELLHRIEVATAAHLSEFKNRLASEVAKIVSHVPPHGVRPSPDMTTVLHLRLHEVLGALRAAGVDISK